MITTKTNPEIATLREGGMRLGRILNALAQAVRPGISTLELDEIGERLIIESGGKPSFKGYTMSGEKTPFPASVCVSINDELVHGIPKRERIIRKGDVVGLDIGMVWPASFEHETNTLPNAHSPIAPRGLYTDTAVTVGVGEISPDAKRLIESTRRALDIGIAAVRDGATVGDVGCAIQAYLKKRGLGVVRDLAGHGVGYKVHEDPFIPNYGSAGKGVVLKENMVIAIEPMAALGDWRVVLDSDRWTFKMGDGSLSAHFEHTLAVTRRGCEVLTAAT